VEYGARIAEALGLKLDKVVELSKMGHTERLRSTSEAEWK
jgi:hypothetical protein